MLGVSRFVVALTVFGLLCARHSGVDRFLIGVALANRISRRFQSVVGMFINMVPYPTTSNDSYTPFTTPSSRSQLGGGPPVYVTNIRRLPDGRVTFHVGYEYQ